MVTSTFGLFKMKTILNIMVFTGLLFAQFGEIKIEFDNRLLKVYEQQNLLPLKQDITRFIKTTRWDEEYSDLKIPLNIQFIFEGRAQKGSLETYLAQVLITNGTDQRYFDKSVQFHSGKSSALYYDVVQFDPLASLLAFYVNLVLAGEIDTYQPNGGTRIYEICREIALRGSASEYSRGWADRLKLANDLSANFGLRKAKFAYYYGMDLLKDSKMEEAIVEFNNMTKGLYEVYDRSAKEHYTMLFLKAHCGELAKVLPILGQKKILKELMVLDPDNGEVYKKAIQ